MGKNMLKLRQIRIKFKVAGKKWMKKSFFKSIQTLE